MNRRTFASTLAVSLAFLAAAAVTPAQGLNKSRNKDLIASGQEEGWIPLFDGKSLDGWKVNDFTNGSKWEVKDGMMCGSGTASMIWTEKGGFKNFRFRAEIKINDKGNSGMYFRTKPNPGFVDGYECQINSTHSDPIKTGSIYTWVHIFEQLVPPDTWFTQEIEVRDFDFRGKIVTMIVVKVNDKVLYQFLDHTREFKEGHFAFQQHDPGSKVFIRKAEVMPLKDETPGK